MPGVMPALKTRNHIGPLGEPVDDFAFTFVTPLGAYDNNIGHDIPLKAAADPPHAQSKSVPLIAVCAGA